jgi:hypothetical protein
MLGIPFASTLFITQQNKSHGAPIYYIVIDSAGLVPLSTVSATEGL